MDRQKQYGLSGCRDVNEGLRVYYRKRNGRSGCQDVHSAGRSYITCTASDNYQVHGGGFAIICDKILSNALRATTRHRAKFGVLQPASISEIEFENRTSEIHFL